MEKLTKHLSRADNAFKAFQNIAQLWVTMAIECLDSVDRIEHGAEGCLVSGSGPKSDNFQVLEHDTELSGLDTGLDDPAFHVNENKMVDYY